MALTIGSSQCREGNPHERPETQKSRHAGPQRICAFEPFSQEEQGCVNTNYAGSGLGLSIAKQLIELMGGLDAARKIRSLDRPDAASIPIFAMMANAFTDDIQRSFDAGMNEHLTKPLQESEIIRALHKYLNERLRNSLV